jgi:hypothetical protein
MIKYKKYTYKVQQNSPYLWSVGKKLCLFVIRATRNFGQLNKQIILIGQMPTHLGHSIFFRLKLEWKVGVSNGWNDDETVPFRQPFHLINETENSFVNRFVYHEMERNTEFHVFYTKILLTKWKIPFR